jgi:epoxyqueuosine reductase QueG
MLGNDLEQMLLRRGAALVAHGSLIGLPPEPREGMPVGVSIGVALDPRIIGGIEKGPTPEYYVEYSRANRLLDSLSAAAAQFLEERGSRAKPLAATNVGVNPATHSTPLPHKTIATRAGVGWIGKCALLVTEQFGSAIRLATVLTDADLPVAQPVNECRCGACTACVDICPAGAPSGTHWEAGLERDAFYDAFACRAAASEIAAKAGIDETICGMCIAACPWTKRYIKRRAGTTPPPA